MQTPENGVFKERVDFSKIKTSIPIPNLIEVQKNSYEKFLQMDLLPNERDDIGLQTVFTSVFPISDFRGVSQLEFVDYSIGNWECKCGNHQNRPVPSGRHPLPPLRHVQPQHRHLL
jgi:DNA-directed RNA polymerase subunit beta